MAIPDDPLIQNVTGFLAAIGNDPDFGPLFPPARRITDTQAGFAAVRWRIAIGEFPQFRMELGDGSDDMFSSDNAFASFDNFPASQLVNWDEPMKQAVKLQIIYAASNHDTIANRQKYEWPLLVAIRRLGPCLGMPNGERFGSVSIRRGTHIEQGSGQSVSRPMVELTVPIKLRFQGNTLI